MGLGSGAVITPNHTLSLARVDPVSGSTAGGVLQTAQRIGSAVGQAVIGAVFFAAVPTLSGPGGEQRSDGYGVALQRAIAVTLVFIGLSLMLGLLDLLLTRRRSLSSPAPRV